MLARLVKLCDGSGLLVEEQGGFRRGRGTLDQIFTLHEVVASRRERRLPTFLAFLDCRRAYDRVWREGLLLKLLEAGVTGQMFRLLQSMLASGSKRRVVVGGESSDAFETTVGLPQGAVLSPLLYALFINGLAVKLNQLGCGVDVFGRRVSILLYADDIVLVAESAEELQRMLDATGQYAREWQFRFNTKPGKSDVVICGTKQQCSEAVPEFCLGEGVLRVSPQYKYLGVEMGKIGRGAWATYLERALGKADFAMRQLVHCVTGRSQLRLTTTAHLFKTLVRPVLEYGDAIWGAMCSKEELRSLNRVQEQFGRRVLGLNFRAHSVFVRRELGLESMEERVMLATLRFFGRLRAMPDTRLAGFIFRQRCAEVNLKRAKLSWCRAAKEQLETVQLEDAWDLSSPLPDDWRKELNAAVRAEFERRDSLEMKAKPLLELYQRLGPPTVKGWLDKAVKHPGAALRVQLRSGWLPLMDAIGESKRLPREERKCRLCGTGAVETAEHFAAECPFNGPERAECLKRLRTLLGASASPQLRDTIAAGDVSLFLGDRWTVGLPEQLSKALDSTVCNFLHIAWRKREPQWQTLCDDGDPWKPKAD